MNKEHFEKRIKEMSALAATLPKPERDRLERLIEETRARHELIQDSVKRALEALDDWRLHQKYLIFDREASRREERDRWRKRRDEEDEVDS